MRLTARSTVLFFVLVLVTMATAVGRTRAASAEGPDFAVIVHPQNPQWVLDRTFVADVFLKKTTRWPDGNVIKPVDLSPDSPVRERFSSDVLRRSVRAVKSYWQQMIFSGRDVPPPELGSEDEVVKYVLSRPNAIGYVSSTARIGEARIATVRR